MQSKTVLNLILLVVIAALALVVYLDPGKEQQKTETLTSIDPESLTHFELQNTDTLVFDKQDEHWRIVAPIQAPANDGRIKQLLELTQVESRASYPLKPEDLAKFGLDKPKAILKLGQSTLVFGGSDPIDMNRYVQVGDTLHLIPDDAYRHLIASPTDFVDKKLLPEDAKLQTLTLPGLKARHGDKGQWVVEPQGEASAMAELASAWQAARAVEVESLTQPVKGELIQLGLAEGKIEFVIVQRDPDLILARPDWKLQYVIPDDTGKRLLSLQKPSDDEDKLDDLGEGENHSAEHPERQQAPEPEPGQDVEDGE